MLDEYPFKIARKNWYKSDKHSFIGSTTNRKNPDDDLAMNAAAFLKKSDLGFLVAVQLDMGKPVWKAWTGPYLIAKSIGLKNFNPAFISKLNKNTMVNILSKNRLGCRNLPHNRAANNLKELCKIIVKSYEGKASNIWEFPASFDELKENILGLPGFGIGLTNMILRDFLILGMIPQIKKTAHEMENLQVKPDVHVKRVFYRTGLADKENVTAALKAAKKYSSNCPMALDFAAFIIGIEYCGSKKCYDCPLCFRKNKKDLCPKIGL